MITVIAAQLRRRTSRALALLVGVLFATTGFTVLTASTATSQLRVEGEILAHSRGAYDILVRPAGARTALEAQRGLVRANFLAGQYGGITTDQWDKIAAVPGVEVAAPIAMLGYSTLPSYAHIDITDLVDRSLPTQVIRVDWTWRADGGLTSAPEPVPSLIYVTKNRIVYPDQVASQTDDHYVDGQRRSRDACGRKNEYLFYEIVGKGVDQPLCLESFVNRNFSVAAQLLPNGEFGPGDDPSPRLVATIATPLTVLAAAVDPDAEAALVGLDRSIVKGRYLYQSETLTPVHEIDANGREASGGYAPILIANESHVDEWVDATAQRLPTGSLAGLQHAAIIDSVARTPSTLTRTYQTSNQSEDYRSSIQKMDLSDPNIGADLSPLLLPGAVSYAEGPDGSLRPHVVAPADQRWPSTYGLAPRLAEDNAFRALPDPTKVENTSDILGGHVVGVFDRSRLNAVDPLVAPLDTYTPPTATGADERSRDLLSGKPVLPNGSPAGYLATSPTVLLSLNSVLVGSSDPAPISAVRVRIAGLTGFDEQSRERVRLIAEDIARTTGLDVEIMLGASGQPQTIDLPAGSFGRPELRLAELWSKKGVAAAIIQAVDRKSVVLFGLILVVCVLFLANAAAAAVRDRRRELAVLACMGWPRHRLAALIVGEVGALGLTAGVASALLARPLAGVLAVEVSTGHAWMAVPVALGLCAVAALVPALGAARTHPATALHRAVARPPRLSWLRARPRTIAGLSLSNLRRTPGRTLLGAGALALGTGGLTLVAAITWAFHGTITGTLLGDAISVRVRGVDLAAVIATLVVALVAVADVLYLNVRDRAGEFALLRASGWSNWALGRLIVFEGVGIGVLGASAGAGLSLVLAASFAGGYSPSLVRTALVVGAAGVVLAAVAALLPAVLQNRVPASAVLAED